MTQGESRGPSHGEIADMVNFKPETTNIAPEQYRDFLRDKLAMAEQRRDQDMYDATDLELSNLFEQFPRLREDVE